MFDLSPDECVERLFLAVLGRKPEPGAAAFWTQMIRQTGDPTRVLRALTDSVECKDRERGRFTALPWEETGGAASIRFEEIAGLAQSHPNLPAGFDVLVPVFNAASWIGILADAYEAYGIRPLYIVDAGSKDSSLDLLRARGARLFTATNIGGCVESLLRGLIPYLGGRWVVRFDDDELPTRGTLSWIARQLDSMTVMAVALPRRSVRFEGAVANSCLPADGSWGHGLHYRLFRPAHVMPTQVLHTAGFVFASSYLAPSQAAFLHFDWIVRDEAERARKLDIYEAHTVGGGGAYASHYLPERMPAGYYATQMLDDAITIEACRRLGDRALR